MNHSRSNGSNKFFLYFAGLLGFKSIVKESRQLGRWLSNICTIICLLSPTRRPIVFNSSKS